MDEQWFEQAAPRKAGELAVLSYPHVPRDLESCRHHIFRVKEAEPTRIWQSQSGYLQRAECLVCGKVTERLDSSWWLRSPSREQLAEAGMEQ